MTPIDLSIYAQYVRIKQVEQKDYIRCLVRNKDLVLQPEELVRQLLLIHLTRTLGYPLSLIQVEKEVKVNKLSKRFDIIVYNHEMQPHLLIECKSHTLKISQKGLDQIGRYNLVVQAPYIVLTNGNHFLCAAIDVANNAYTIIDEIPIHESPLQA